MLGVLVGAADADRVHLVVPAHRLLTDEAEQLSHLYDLRERGPRVQRTPQLGPGERGSAPQRPTE